MVVAVAIKVVGVLLIVAMLIVPAAAARPFSRTPAAAARPFSRTPEAMAVISAIMGGAAAPGGLQAACQLNTPTGPTIVSLAAILFALSALVSALRGSPR